MRGYVAVLPLAGMLSFATSARGETEPNNDQATADPIAMVPDGRVNGLNVGVESGVIDVADSSNDWFAFQAVAGDRILVTVHTLSGDLDPGFFLRRPSGTWAAGDNDDGPGNAARVHDIAADETGSWVVDVYQSGGTGSFEVRVLVVSQGRTESDDNGANDVRAAADVLAYRGTATQGELAYTPSVGNLDVGDQDWYGIYAFSGAALQVEMTAGASGTLSPILEITDDTGASLGTATDTNFDGIAAISNVVIPRDGLYFIRASGMGNGFNAPYQIQATTSGNSSEVEVEPNDDQASATPIPQVADGRVSDLIVGRSTGEIGLAGDISNDWFSFQAVAGDRILVTVHTLSGDLDPGFFLRRPSGTWAAGDNDDGPGNAARVHDVAANETGSWVVDVYQSGGTGSFEVRVLVVSQGRTEADDDGANNDLASANDLEGVHRAIAILDPGDEDFFRGYLRAGQEISIRTSRSSGGTLDPAIELFDSIGISLATNTNGGADGIDAAFSYRAPRNMDFVVRVYSESGAGFSAVYALSLEHIGLPGIAVEQEPNNALTTATPLTFSQNPGGESYYGAFAQGRVRPADPNDYYAFDLVQGDRFFVTLAPVDAADPVPFAFAYDSQGVGFGQSFLDVVGEPRLVTGLEAVADGTYSVRVNTTLGSADYDLRIYVGPRGTFQWGGTAFSLTASPATWETSRSAAQAAGGLLVTIDSREENEFLYKAFGDFSYWIGFNDVATEGTWAWVSGTGGTWQRSTQNGTSFTNWGSGAPADDTNRNGALMYQYATLPGQWLDGSNTDTHRGIVELFGAQILAPRVSPTLVVGDGIFCRGGRLGSVAAGALRFAWNFGDGRTSAAETPGLTTYTSTGTFNLSVRLQDHLGVDVGAPDTMTVNVLPDDGMRPDLTVQRFEIPSDLTVSVARPISYRATNRGDGPATGAWTDVIYLSEDDILDARDVPLGLTTVSGPVAVNAVYSGNITISVPLLPDGVYYLILSLDDQAAVLEKFQGNNRAAAATDVAMSRLAFGAPETRSFLEDGEAHYYRVDVASGASLTIDILATSNDQACCMEVYARRGAPPTRGQYDYRSEHACSNDRIILAEAPIPGDWYVMVIGCDEAGAYDISADAVTFGITNVSPRTGNNTGLQDITIIGAGFTPSTAVRLVSGTGTEHAPAQSALDSFTQITATYDLSGVPPGVYTVRVSHPGSTADSPSAFEVVSNGQAVLETNLVLPSWVGRHAVATLYLHYANTGNVAMPAPVLSVWGDDGALLTLDADDLPRVFWTAATEEFDDTVQILASGAVAGVLHPGESARVPIYYAGLQPPWDMTDRAVRFEVRVLDPSTAGAIDWARLKPLVRPRRVNQEAWDQVYANLEQQIGPTWGDYAGVMVANASYLARLGQRVVDLDKLLNFEVRQAMGYSVLSHLHQITDLSVPSPDPPLRFGRAWLVDLPRRFESGPLGYGWRHNWQYDLSEDSGTIRITMPSGEHHVFLPDLRGGYLPAPDGGTLTEEHSGEIHLLEVDGTEIVFSASHLLSSVRAPAGPSVSAEHQNGLLVRLWDASNAALELGYDGSGRIQSVLDPYGREARFSYDANGHLVTATDIYGAITSYTYSPKHALLSISGNERISEGFQYDAQERLTSYTYGGANPTTFAQDALATLTMTSSGRVYEFVFDHTGSVVRRVAPLGNMLHLIYDERHHAVTLSAGPTNTVSLINDAEGRMTQFVDPMGRVSRVSYGANGQLSTLTDPEGRQRAYSYDVLGNLTEIRHPDGAISSFAHGSAGELNAHTNRQQQTTTYTYQGNGRLLRTDYPDGTFASFAYDKLDRLQSYANAWGTTTLIYNAQDRLEQITYPGGRSLHYTYDAMGRRSRMEDELGHVTVYAYDALGRISALTDGLGSPIVLFSYDAQNQLTEEVRGNGVRTVYVYDAGGRMVQVDNLAANGDPISSFTYTYDDADRAASVSFGDGTWSYGYNDAGELISAVFVSSNPLVPDQDLAYHYDAAGNRRRVIDNGLTENYLINLNDTYGQRGNWTYTHDAEGRVTRRSNGTTTVTHAYDGAGRLQQMTAPGEQVSFTYDALGNLVQTVRNGVVTAHVIDPLGMGFVVADYDATGNQLARYSHVGQMVARHSGSQSAYYCYDGDGHTMNLVDQTGAVTHRYVYGPFGRTLYAEEPTENPWRFVGARGIRTITPDLLQMRARFYHPEDGRFLQEDPLWLLGGQTNLYTYANNDPVNYLDPTGSTSLSGIASKFKGEIGKRVAVSRGGSGGGGQALELGAKAVVATKGALTNGQQTAEENANSGIDVITAVVPGAVGVLAETLRPDVYRGMSAIANAQKNYNKALNIGGEEGDDEETREFECVGPGCGSTVPLQVQTSSSSDPNQKVCAGGVGPQGYRRLQGAMSFRIDFENESSASAPAQRVDVTDPLDPNFDWNTFEVTEVGFGDRLIAAPPGLDFFEVTPSATYLGVTFDIHIQVGIDRYTGEVFAHYQVIDPATQLPPPVEIGFLPPEDGTGRGQGHFSYTVKPKSNLAEGDEIRNIATIIFDLGEVIRTNQIDPHDPSQGNDPAKECLNTFDMTPPTSAMTPLPTLSVARFELSWTGQDLTSGIATWDVYQREAGAAWSVLQAEVPTSTLTFTGDLGATYEFYVVATDHAGHREVKAPQVEATTTVDADADTDGDGMPDAWETTAGLDPFDASDGQGDEDADGLSNSEEFANGTDPHQGDTDGDGMDDRWEVDHGIDPTTSSVDEDTDNDGFTDLEEYRCATLPNDETSVPAPPVADAGDDQTVAFGATVTLDGSASSDPDGTITLYLWRQSAGVNVVLSTPDQVATNFTAPTTPGSLTFVLEVTDSCGLVRSDEVQVRVGENTFMANAGPDQTAGPGVEISLDGRRSKHPDGGELTYRWTQVAGTPVNLDDATDNTPTFVTASSTGTLAFELIVSKGSAESAPDQTEVYVTDTTNTPPIANAGEDVTVAPGATVILNGGASNDDDGDTLSYLWSQSAGPGVDLDDPSAMTPSFAAPEEETVLELKLVVRDGEVNSLPATITVRVEEEESGCGCASNVQRPGDWLLLLLQACSRSVPTSQMAALGSAPASKRTRTARTHSLPATASHSGVVPSVP